jgi:hypothetical protein
VAPIAQSAEAADLKSAKCRFESDWGHDWGRATGSAWCQVVLRPVKACSYWTNGVPAPPWCGPAQVA